MIPPVSSVAALSPYALADLSPPAGKRLISLAQNESLRAPSPKATEAANAANAALNLYPDPDWTGVRQALGALHDIPSGQILCGNGSMELIGALIRAYADKDNAVLAPRHAYPFFRTASAIAGARYDVADEVETTVSVDTLLAAVRPDTRAVLVANPGNPTGTRISSTDLTRLRTGLRHDILLVIDEAYGEFTDHLNEPCFDMVSDGNTVVLRTFSKAYGLAGLRVGWGLFPPAIAIEIRKLMNPNNVSVAGQAAAAAAVRDQTYMRETCALTARLRDGLTARLHQAGLNVADSFTNFVTIRFDTASAAQSADQALRAGGVFLRPQGGAGMPHCLRATIGVADDLDIAADLLEHWKDEV